MARSLDVQRMLARISAENLERFPDADLLERFITERDAAAFELLVERHSRSVLGVCRRTLGHVQDAEDAAQAVFLILARSVRRVRNPQALSAWLHAVAARVARKALARQRRKAEPLPDAVPAAESFDQATWASTRRVIDEALAALPESLREPLVLCYLEGLTRDEAAARLGVPLDTLRGRLERGRQKLRAALARRGFPLSAGLLAVLLESPATASPEWVSETVALAVGSAAPSPVVAALTAGVLPMMLTRHWIVGAALAALVCGGAIWAAGVPSPAAAPAPRTAEPAVEDEPFPLLPKDRSGVFRSISVSADKQRIDTSTIRFLNATELVWESQRREPGVNGKNGTRYLFSTTAAGKLVLTPVAQLMSDGLEWSPHPGEVRPPVGYTIVPLDKACSSFQLVQLDVRGRKILDAVFRHEADLPQRPDPLVPDYLTKIDRTIKKEPKYVNDPKYVLVAFGPKAEFKVWVVVDGDVVYIDRNGNGDLTDDGERNEAGNVEKNVVRQASGELSYRLPGTKRTILNSWWFHTEQARTGGFVGVFVDDHISQTAGGHELNYAPSPDLAAVIHFGSPVVSFRPSTSTSVERQWRRPVPDANGEVKVAFEVGTPGVGAGNREDGMGSFAAFAHTNTGHRDKPSLLPAGLDPIAEFEFSPLDPAQGLKKVKVKLSEHLGQTEFVGKITVPNGVKTGIDAAKVTLSFPDCPWGKVEPLTIAMDVIPKTLVKRPEKVPVVAKDLVGVWRSEVTTQSEPITTITETLRFEDGKQLIWHIQHRGPGVDTNVTFRGTYELKDGELEWNVTKKLNGEKPESLRPDEARRRYRIAWSNVHSSLMISDARQALDSSAGRLFKIVKEEPKAPSETPKKK